MCCGHNKKRMCEGISSECVCDVTVATGFRLGVREFMYKGPEMPPFTDLEMLPMSKWREKIASDAIFESTGCECSTVQAKCLVHG